SPDMVAACRLTPFKKFTYELPQSTDVEAICVGVGVVTNAGVATTARATALITTCFIWSILMCQRLLRRRGSARAALCGAQTYYVLERLRLRSDDASHARHG